MVDWYLGTIGFSYKDWDGVFYPAGMSPRSYLAHYSQIFNAVELDSTFYGPPPVERVRQWAQTAPAGFKFCPKTPREITHDLRLIGAQPAMMTFLEAIGWLGDKLGAILIQLPPSFTAVEFDTIAAFLTSLPSDLRYAVEFRHPSWYVSETAELLKAQGMAWVSLDYLDLPKQIGLTTDFLYIRWLGEHGRFEQKNQEQIDATPELTWWWNYIQPHLGHVQTIYGFFNNEYAGFSPGSCNRFKSIAGLPITHPQLPQQDRLF
jgi:uncharacterized protein YecE (DUF72 family)